MKQIELRLIDRELPEVWDYDEEVKKAQKLARRWATVTTQFLQTLWTAREVLSQRPKGKLVSNGTSFNWNIPSGLTWTKFLEQTGIARQTAQRWLASFDPATGERKPKAKPSAVTDDKKNGNPGDIQGQYAVVEDQVKGPRPRINTYRGEKFQAIATLKRKDLDAIMKPVIAQVEHAYRKIQAHTGDGSAMASVVNLTTDMMRMRDQLNSWTMSKTRPCPRCEGTQKVTRDDQDGKPVTIKCPHCIEGYVGSLDLDSSS